MYSESKGKVIYVGSWAQTEYPYLMPKLDFALVSPSPGEVRKGRLDKSKRIGKNRYKSEKSMVMFQSSLG